MNKKVMRLATPGRRLAAYLIDKIVPAIIGIILLVSFITLYSNTRTYDSFGCQNGFSLNGGLTLGSALGSISAVLVSFFIFLAYLAVQIYFYTKSKTIGKAVMGIHVVNSNDGKPIGVFFMILREWFAKKAVGSIFWLGYIWILIDDKNRGWHDKIMDTYVVEDIEVEETEIE